MVYLRLASSQREHLRRLDSSLLVNCCVASVYHELSQSYATQAVTTVRVHG